MAKLALLMLLFGCSSDSPPPGTVLDFLVTTHDLTVGQKTSIAAFFNDGKGGTPVAVEASWSTSPNGIVTLTDLGGNYQTVTAVAAGTVVVTADALGETAKTGFTVTAP